MKHTILLSSLLLPILIGCGNGSSTATGDTPVTSITRSVDALDISMTLQKTEYAQGEAIPITLNVKNNGLRDVTLVFSSSANAAYIVRQGSTEIASPSLPSAQVLTYLPLKKNERYSGQLQWTQQSNSAGQVPPGTYTVRAYIPGNIQDAPQTLVYDPANDLVSAPVDITIR